jgi:ABC-type phosphate transport system substrate-binding protein
MLGTETALARAMNRAQPKRCLAVISVFAALALPGCGGSNSPPQDPTGASSKPPPDSAANGDPTAGPSDFNTAPSSAAPLGAGEGMAGPDPAQTPVVTSGTGSGDTPINSGAGDAAPVHAH